MHDEKTFDESKKTVTDSCKINNVQKNFIGQFGDMQPENIFNSNLLSFFSINQLRSYQNWRISKILKMIIPFLLQDKSFNIENL